MTDEKVYQFFIAWNNLISSEIQILENEFEKIDQRLEPKLKYNYPTNTTKLYISGNLTEICVTINQLVRAMTDNRFYLYN